MQQLGFSFDQFKKYFGDEATPMDRAWAEGVLFEADQDKVLRFRLASPLHADFFATKFQPSLERWLKDNSLEPLQVSAQVDPSIQISVQEPVEDDIEAQIERSLKANKQRQVRGSLTFDNFIVGASNEFAFKASLMAGNSPGIIANPLFIHSPSGLGKSHLASAIVDQRRQVVPGSKALYISGEQFLNQFVDAIRTGQMSAFRHKIRFAPDLLIIDDIHTIGKGEKVQEELFNTLNHYFHESKQVVITCDQKPSELKSFADRVRTRLSGGVILEIGWPDYQLRQDFIQRHLQNPQMLDCETLVQSLALKNHLSLRELQGVLNTINFGLKLNGAIPSTESIERLISGFEKKESSLQGILEAVAKKFDVNVSDLVSKKRNKPISHARQVFMYVARECDYTSKDIGRALCRDHSTVLAGVKKIKSSMNSDTHLKSLVEGLIIRS